MLHWPDDLTASINQNNEKYSLSLAAVLGIGSKPGCNLEQCIRFVSVFAQVKPLTPPQLPDQHLAKDLTGRFPSALYINSFYLEEWYGNVRGG